jgi:putative aldouronate transport system permease protein
MGVRKSGADKAFDMFNVVFMLIVCFLIVYPLWYVLIHSFNDGYDSARGGVYWLPRQFTLDNYKQVFIDHKIMKAFLVTILRTALVTPIHVFFTAMVAYAFNKKELIGRKLFMTMGIITMFFSGGLIPSYVVNVKLGLYDSPFIYLFPTMFSFFDLIIFQAFFRTIPEAMEESAKIDGANAFTTFNRIILPVSKAVIATIVLFNGVWNWNEFFMANIYFTNQDMYPIQTYLYKIIVSSDASRTSNIASSVSTSTFTSTSLQMATMFVTTVPIMCIYPFLQKHFVKGMMLGSVKE